MQPGVDETASAYLIKVFVFIIIITAASQDFLMVVFFFFLMNAGEGEEAARKTRRVFFAVRLDAERCNNSRPSIIHENLEGTRIVHGGQSTRQQPIKAVLRTSSSSLKSKGEK